MPGNSEKQSYPARRWRQHLLPLLGWTAAWALFFGTLLLGWEYLPAGDFLGQFHAFARFQAAEIAGGRLPLWSPYSYGGFPFAADTQAAAFYLPRWLTILLSPASELPFYALQLEAMLHLWLAGAFTYALAYALTRQRAAGLLAALTFALGGYLTSYPILQLAVLETIAWLPLALLLLRLSMLRKRPLPWLLGTGLVLALAFSAGHPQTFLHVSYLAAAYYLFLAWQARWSWRWLAGGGLFVAAVVAGVAAIAWLPALRLALLSTRAAVDYDFVSGGTSLLNYLQLVLPGLLTQWPPEYVGLLPLLLVLIAWYGRSGWQDVPAGNAPAARTETVFWLATAVVAAWLALGGKGLLFQLFYYGAPGFSLFRGQERLLGLLSLSLALLASQGLALWLHLEARQIKQLLRPAGLTAGILFLLAGSYILFQPQATLPIAGWLWLRQALLFALFLFVLAWGGRRRRPALVLLLIFGALDLGIAGYPSLARHPGSSDLYWPQPAWLERLQEDLAARAPARIDSRNLFQANIGQVYRLEDLHGISPLEPAFVKEFERVPKPRRWQLLNVAYVLGGEPVPEAIATPVDSFDPEETLIPGWPIPGTVYQLAESQPRAWLAYEPLPVADADAALSALQEPALNVGNQIVLHPPLPPLAGIAPPSTPPVVETTRLRADTLRVAVTTESPALLALSEWAYPGWQAFLDGERVPLYPAYYALQAVSVPAGSHVLEFRFRPPDVIAGAIITVLALLFFPLLVWRWRPSPVLLPAGIKRLPVPTWPRPVRAGWLSRHWRILFLLLFLLAFALRLFNLGGQELRGDEGFSYLYTRPPLLEVIPSLAQDGDPHPPLHYLLLNAWTRVAGATEFALRFLSAAGSVLLLPLLFQLGRQLQGKKLGLLLAALVAVSQSQVWLGQDVRNQYVFTLLFSILATLFLVRAVQRRRWHLWAGYAFAAALVMYSHYYGLFALLAHGLYLLATPQHRRALLAWLGAGLGALLLFSPWLVLGLSGWQGQLTDPGGVELTAYLVDVGQELTVGPAFPEAVGPWIFIIALLLALTGWATLWQRHHGWAALLGGWLAAAVWGIFLIRLRRATFNEFYISVAAPAWWALIGVGLHSLWSRRGRWRRPAGHLALVAFLVLVAAGSISLTRYYRDPIIYGRTNGYRPLAGHVAAQQQPGDLLVPNFPDPSLTYYFRDVALPTEMQPAAPGLPPAQTEATLQDLTTRYERLWFVPIHNSAWDPEDIVFRWLDYHTILEEERDFGNLTLQAYRPLSTADEILTPIGLSLEGQLSLEGAYVTVNGVADGLADGELILPSGAEVEVSLVWQAERPLSEEYTVFVHLLGEQGQLIAQHDGVPAHGTRPTPTWQAGELLLDEHQLLLPPEIGSESAVLVAGMYNSETLERQLFAGAGERITLATVRFRPVE